MRSWQPLSEYAAAKQRLLSAGPRRWSTVLDSLRMLGNWRRAVVDLVFPPCCPACRKAVTDPGALCSTCWRDLRLIERPFCERLGAPFAVDLGTGQLVSPEAIAKPPVFSRARAVVHFDGPARRLVHRLKYGDRLELATMMGAWMARAGAEMLEDADILVPIPLHRTRLASRRFNQSVMLANAISAECGVPVDTTALIRRKPTAPQIGLTRTQRGLNVQGAFQVPQGQKPKLENKAAVLIDDVMTSGATLNAAARSLLRSGVNRVDALVFAMVVTGA